MTNRWELDEVEISGNAESASLGMVKWITSRPDADETEWTSAVRLAHANGASLRDIAAVAGVAPQTVSKVVKG